MKRPFPAWLIPALSVLWFFVAGLLLIPGPGLQNDELFFAGPLYYPDAAFYNLQLGAHKIPLMVMSYTGALKTWLYAGLFEFFEPNRWSVRVPVILMGMATIWLTWLWVRRIAGVRAAAVTTVLLATDTIFLMTDTFDWGPVALQHILLMGGILAIQIWISNNSKTMLAIGFVLLGLGIWDKALLAWPLIGLTLGSFCIFPREVFRRIRPLAVGIALGSFCLGAAPLIWYNIQRPGETATANARFTTEGLGAKEKALKETIDGTTLFGYMVYEDPGKNPRKPRTLAERVSVWISSVAPGHHRQNWMLAGGILAILCLGGLWGSTAFRPLLFLALVCVVEWAQMAFNAGTGGASHHVILMWPFPVVFIGIAFSAMSRRIPRHGLAVLAAVTAVLVTGNLLNTNEYLAEFAVNGGMGGWTDAIYPLARSVEKGSASWIGLVDWGCLNPLLMLHEGDLPLFLPDVPAGPQAYGSERVELQNTISDSSRLFIQHTDDKQIFPGVNVRFRQAAAELGYQELAQRVIRDRNGRPVFELFRFGKVAQ